MTSILLLIFYLHAALASSFQKPLTSQDQHGPSIASATKNANLLFNAIYASMRQWGSSAQHNGMSFFPGYIPGGTLLYHGDRVTDRPKGLEWLAFEIPHAEMFSRGFRRRNCTDDGKGNEIDEIDTEYLNPRDMSPQYLWGLEDRPCIEIVPGHLQIYQTNRPLKVLYLDGMAAAKCTRGTLDTQDLLLLNNFTGGGFADYERARRLCDLGAEWGVEGFIRMECGFELIKCDFSNGLDYVSHKLRPRDNKPEGWTDMFMLDFVRDIANRYQGIDGGRVHLDYSYMVSAYFYPANLSNPSQNPGQWKLPRLVETGKEVLQRIKSDVGLVVKDWKPTTGVDWQGVADMIIKRYSARLRWMASGMSQDMFLSQANMLMNTFIDYDVPDQDPITVCSEHYLQPIESTTESDRLIEAAFKTVTQRICSTIFEVRESLLEKQDDKRPEDHDDVTYEKELIRDLNDWLDWSDWQACGQCGVDEVCLIAIFPYGTTEDHYNPRCVNNSNIDNHGESRDNYWFSERH